MAKLWRNVINYGITSQLSFEEKKITSILNILVLSGIPFCLFFCLLNFIQNRIPLSVINLLTAIGGVCILFINKQRKYLAGRLFLSILGMLVFAVSSVLYSNGVEYFLLMNIVTTIILYKNKLIVLIIALLNALLFLLLFYAHQQGVTVHSVPAPRLYLNVGWAVIFIIIVLYFFKNQHISYQEKVEQANNQLIIQRHTLINQKLELEAKTSELKKLNKLREKLLSVVAHDLRSPIASLKSTLDLYNNQYISNEEIKQISVHLTNEVENLYHNLDNLLQWSYSQFKGLQVNARNIYLRPLFLETISLLNQFAAHKQIGMIENIPSDLEVFADPDHVKVIIRNLLTNAIKYSKPNSEIRLEATEQLVYTEIRVIDQGIGMSASKINTLFNTNLVTDRGTLGEKGTGLGLALCKEFVERNNGRLFVTSEVGQGSTFMFTLPLKQKYPAKN